MSPAMLDILRSCDPVKIIYLTAGDAAKDEAYWRSREQAIAQTHAHLRKHGNEASQKGSDAALELVFLRLADGMLQGQGAPAHQGESLRKLWRGDIPYMHALDGQARYTREALIVALHTAMVAWQPTLLHTLNGLAYDAREHADHHATGLFAAAAACRLRWPVDLRFYVGSNSPQMSANITDAALADKVATFADYARHDAEIFNGREDWLTASIYAPMLKRQHFTACRSDALRLVGDTAQISSHFCDIRHT